MAKESLYDHPPFKGIIESSNPLLLEAKRVVDWEGFRPRLESAWGDLLRQSAAAGEPWDCVMMFRMVLLGDLYRMSDGDAAELVSDRFSFRHFVGAEPYDPLPDKETFRAYREVLAQAGVTKALFAEFDRQLAEIGIAAKKGRTVQPVLFPVDGRHDADKGGDPVGKGEDPPL